MSVNLGTAEGKIILDTSGFVTALQSAQQGIGQFSSTVTTRLGSALQSLGSSFMTFGNMLNTAISRPLQDFVKGAISEMKSFEDGLNRAGVIAGANAEELEALSNKAKEMGKTTKFSATEATQALQYMGMAGWKTDQMLEGLPGIMYLAAASGEDLALVSDIVTDALTGFKLEAKDAGHFADVLTAATLNSNTTVGALGEAFKYVGTQSGLMGYSIEDVSLALGLMANSSIKGSQAGTALAGALRRMSTQPGIVKGKMEELGLTLYDTAGNAKPLREVLVDLRGKFSGMTTQAKVTNAAIIFGARAMPGLLAVVNASEKDFNKLVNALDKCTGAAKKTADAMMADLQGQLLILQSTLSAFKLQFATDVLPILTDFTRKVIEVAEKLTNLDSGARKMVIALVGFGAALGPIVAGFGSFLVLIGGGIVSIGMLVSTISELAALIGISAAAFTGWGAAIVAALGVVAAGFAVVSAAVADLVLTSSKFRGQLADIFNEIMQVLADFEAEIVNAFKDAGFQVKDFWDALLVTWEYIKGLIGPIVIFVLQILKNLLINIFTSLTNAVKFIDGLILMANGQWSAGLNKILEALKGQVASFFQTIAKTLLAGFGFIGDLFRGLSDAGNISKQKLAASADNISKTLDKTAASAEKNGEKIKNGIAGNAEEARERTEKDMQLFKKKGKEWLEAAGLNAEQIAEIMSDGGATAGADFLGGVTKNMEKVPGAINAQRYPAKIEADKIGSDLIDAGETAGSGFVGMMDAALSWLPAKVKEHLDLTLDYADDFADEFAEIGGSAGADFADTIANKIADLSATLDAKFKAILVSAQNFGDNFTKNVNDKISALPAKVQTSLNTVLANTNTWKTNMINAASAMATQFNVNAGSMAADLSTKLNKNLNASLDVANNWIDKMAKKGGEGAKLFLTAMTNAVDSQGKEIEAFGGVIAERVIEGLRGRMKWFKDELKGMFRDVIDQIEEDLGITDSLSINAAAKMGYASDYGIGAGIITTGTQATAQKVTATTASNTAGTTINFYSPTAINEIEASRLLRQTQREMALGF